MNAQVLRDAEVRRVLIVDDDLSQIVTGRDLDESALEAHFRPSEVLADEDHDVTQALVETLKALDLPSDTVEQRVASLAVPAALSAAPQALRDAYQAASSKKKGMREPLEKIRSWVQQFSGVTIEEWHSARALSPEDRYDLLIIDYFLIENQTQPTLELIKTFRNAHAEQPRPLLVILMSSQVPELKEHFEDIRNQCLMTASRFRILAKPVSVNPDSDLIVQAKWITALSQLANERQLVTPIEAFIEAWGKNLKEATDLMVLRLYDLDASAMAILAATAKRDHMSIEEYVADVLSRRVSAETEHVGFPFKQLSELETALGKAQGKVGPTINQGVEVRHAQHAIRSLMADVAWYRQGWWEPRAQLSSKLAVDAPKEDRDKRENERLSWMKRYVRFGAVLKYVPNGRTYINLTQACDVQAEKLCDVCDVNYLLLRGAKHAVDKVAVGEKSFDSPYYAADPDGDEFAAFQWNMRQPFTPSMAELLQDLESYQIIGQLRSDATYAVLTRFMAQATRVAQIRMPKVFRYEITVYRKQGSAWLQQTPSSAIEASAWQKDDKDWRLQFTVDAADALAQFVDTPAAKDALRSELTKGLKVEAKSTAGSPMHIRAIANTAAYVARVDGRTARDVKIAEEIGNVKECNEAAELATLFVARASIVEVPTEESVGAATVERT